MFLRRKEDSSMQIFLGQKSMEVLPSSVDMLAFDEASRSLAVLDCKKGTVQIYSFSALQTLAATGAIAGGMAI